MEIELEEPQHLYTSEQKIAWFGNGEWVEEPDHYEFSYKGYKCLVKRMVVQDGPIHIFGGHLCGYVEVPKEHPYYEKDYYDMNIECHWELTYSGILHDNYVIGFDCAHSGDYCPSMEKFNAQSEIMQEFKKEFSVLEEFKHLSLFNPVYRNFQFCIDQCKSIVDQLIEICVKD